MQYQMSSARLSYLPPAHPDIFTTSRFVDVLNDRASPLSNAAGTTFSQVQRKPCDALNLYYGLHLQECQSERRSRCCVASSMTRWALSM